MTFRNMKTAALLGAGLLTLAACAKPEPEQPVSDNMSLEESPDEAPTPDVAPTAEATPAAALDTNTAAVDVPADAPVAPDAQMIEDADATGMTARVSRDEASAPAGNDAAAQ